MDFKIFNKVLKMQDLSYMTLSEVQAIFGLKVAIQEEERRSREGVSYEFEDKIQDFEDDSLCGIQ